MHIHYQDGTVYETGKRLKKWAGRIRVYGDGKAKRPNIILGLKSEMTRRQAGTKLRAMIKESGGTPAPVLRPLTFGAYWKEHYIPLRSIRWSQPTRAGYDGYMQSLILPIFEHVFLKDIDHLRLANFFAQLRSRCGYWAMQRIRVLMKAILEEAVQDDLIGKNPMRRLKMPKTEEPDQPYLAKAEIASLLKHMAGNPTRYGIRDYAIARIGTFCAVRSAEVFGLRWDSYLGDRFLIQDSAWEGKLFENTTKKGRRHVGIDAMTKQVIERWKAVCPDAGPEALVFPSEAGTPFASRNWLQRNLQPIGVRLGIKTPLTFQVMRRTFGTHNQKQLTHASHHLGHRSTTTTSRFYVEEVAEEVREMQEGYAGEIDALANPRKNPSAAKLDRTGPKSKRSSSANR